MKVGLGREKADLQIEILPEETQSENLERVGAKRDGTSFALNFRKRIDLLTPRPQTRTSYFEWDGAQTISNKVMIL